VRRGARPRNHGTPLSGAGVIPRTDTVNQRDWLGSDGTEEQENSWRRAQPSPATG
jgi:hypothetical protein